MVDFFKPAFPSSLLGQQQLNYDPNFLSMSQYGYTPGPGGSVIGTGMPATQPIMPSIDQPGLGTRIAQYGAPAPQQPAITMGGAAGAASWRGVPISQMTGDQYKAMLADTQPSNAGSYAQMGLQGVQMAGQLGLGIASLVQGQQAFDKQMGMADKNYAAQITAYNTALEDKIKGRYSMRERKNHAGEIQAEIDRKSQKV